jgi:hypothetical protein
MVQWQDEKGQWHDVNGWRGELDEAEVGADGQAVGVKAWWVAEEDLDKGPFRWQIYQSQGGRLLATSDPFDLPEKARQQIVVEIPLK